MKCCEQRQCFPQIKVSYDFGEKKPSLTDLYGVRSLMQLFNPSGLGKNNGFL
jgi:hypothetical protein